eukprot:1511927-Rhodomonas_salina.4
MAERRRGGEAWKSLKRSSVVSERGREGRGSGHGFDDLLKLAELEGGDILDRTQQLYHHRGRLLYTTALVDRKHTPERGIVCAAKDRLNEKDKSRRAVMLPPRSSPELCQEDPSAWRHHTPHVSSVRGSVTHDLNEAAANAHSCKQT